MGLGVLLDGLVDIPFAYPACFLGFPSSFFTPCLATTISSSSIKGIDCASLSIVYDVI
jgi:hypothetical protein